SYGRGNTGKWRLRPDRHNHRRETARQIVYLPFSLFVERVFLYVLDYPYDFQRPIVNQPLAHRILARKVSPGKCLVNDDNRTSGVGIAVGEVPAAQKPGAHGLEVTRACKVKVTFWNVRPVRQILASLDPVSR